MVTIPVKHAPNSAEVARTCLIKKRKKKIGGYFNRLPCEILHKIALTLPFSSIKHLRSSSKFWYNLVTDPEFVNLHFTCAIQKPPGSLFTAQCIKSRRTKLNCYFLEQSGAHVSTSKIFEYSSTCWSTCRFRCQSSGGLVCVYSKESNCFRVFNPDIREVVQVSDFPKPENWFQLESFLFGYSPSTNEYKILEISTLNGGSKTVGAITTLGSNIWRDIKNVPPYIIKSTTECQGNLFWIDAYGSNVVSFDLASEKFHKIPGPPRDVIYYKHICSVDSLSETLVSMSHTIGYVWKGRLWVLEDKIKGIWVKRYDFSVPSLYKHYRFIVISENDGALFGHVENSVNVFSHDMGCTDFRLMKMNLKEPRGIVAPTWVSYITRHVRSLVSPVRIMENGSQSNS
ncbi:putative F-box protein At1g32420 [Silene latifolia]|uniref:putative F-box protein At1g32420 n=1 Tax=Silene latifolia TaxID=37657 RepID=UPI003D77494F